MTSNYLYFLVVYAFGVVSKAELFQEHEYSCLTFLKDFCTFLYLHTENAGVNGFLRSYENATFRCSSLKRTFKQSMLLKEHGRSWGRKNLRAIIYGERLLNVLY